MGYYDVKRERFVTDEEERKERAQEHNLKTIHKCVVCENETWCKRKEKNKKGCDEEFILNELNIFSEVYKKQNNIS